MNLLFDQRNTLAQAVAVLAYVVDFNRKIRDLSRYRLYQPQRGSA